MSRTFTEMQAARAERPLRRQPRDPNAPRRKPVQREKFVQTGGLELLGHLGAKLYVLGTRRAQRCWKCHEVTKDQGTRQTPGLGDVFGFLPPPPLRPAIKSRVAFWWEVKAPKDGHYRGGKPSAEQKEFRALCLEAELAHVAGDVDALVGFLTDGGWLLPGGRL